MTDTPEDRTHRPYPWRYRNTAFVLGIIGYIADATDDLDKAAWPDVVDHFTDDAHTWKTVEATLYDLIAFGVVHRIGKPGDGRRRRDTRALVTTTLGRAWLDGEPIPIPDIPKETP